MKKKNPIRDAIDESLSGVQFDAQDMQNVLRAVRSEQREAPARARLTAARRTPTRQSHKRRRSAPLAHALCACALVLVIAPLSLFFLRTQGAHTRNIQVIAAAPGENTAAPRDLILPSGDPAAAPQMTAQPIAKSAANKTFTDAEQAAIAAARACFETLCDTGVFSFEEYELFCEYTAAEGTMPDIYTVMMHSIYNNGCFFRVTVSAPTGEVLSHSAPRLATAPMFVDLHAEQVRAWFDAYGEYRFMWPMDKQMEFSRRYEGAMLRMPREGERDAAYIRSAALVFAGDYWNSAESAAVYPVLYSEKASLDGVARYQVYCFQEKQDTGKLPPSCLLLTIRTDGTIENSQLIDTPHL